MVEQQKILILDDSLLFRMITKNILRARGYSVLEGSNGKEGLDLVQQHKPDLVITDVLMPIMDGYEFLRNIRLSPSYSDLKVIFYTGTYSGREEIALAKSGGVSAVLIKPAEPEEILSAVTTALSSVTGTNSEIGPRYEQEHLRILTNQLSKQVLALEQFNDQLSKEIQNRIRAEHEALQSKSFFKALLGSGGLKRGQIWRKVSPMVQSILSVFVGPVSFKI
jgi:CheY-like chemotaxis protein